MSYPYQIKDLAAYHAAYKKVLKNPQPSGVKLLNRLPGKRNGIMY